MTDRSKTVVLLIDWDNLQICHSRDAPGTELDLSAVIALAQSYGTLVCARAYAEWNLPQERLAVYKAGIEPVFAPVMRPEGSTREGKSLADTVMVADGVDLLWTVAPDVFVLVTSDKDMIPLARLAKQRGAAVVILGSDLTAIPLIELSNVFITYRQLIRELDRTTHLDAPTGRAPARERRPSIEARRPSTEPYTGRGIAVRAGRPQPRPSEAAAAAPSAGALAAPAPAPSAPAETPEQAPPPEGAARRRRRRGGRSRGRGATADGVEQPQEAAAPQEHVGAADDSKARDLQTVEEAPKPPAAPVSFSEFGPPPSPVEPSPSHDDQGGETAPPSTDASVDRHSSGEGEAASAPALAVPDVVSENGVKAESADPEPAAKPRRRRPTLRRKAAEPAPTDP